MVERTCTCCGQTLPDKLPADLRLVGQEKTIVSEIWAAGRLGIRSDRLLQKIYAGAADGGPLFASTAMRVRIARLNRTVLAEIGYRIMGQHTGNGAFGQYRLERL